MKLFVKGIIAVTLQVMFVAAGLFLGAGTFYWQDGLILLVIFIIVGFVFVIISSICYPNTYIAFYRVENGGNYSILSNRNAGILPSNGSWAGDLHLSKINYIWAACMQEQYIWPYGRSNKK